MPRIREYEQQTTARGLISTQPANGADLGFGAQLSQAGSAMYDIGAEIDRYKKQQEQETSRREVEDASVRMAEQRQVMTENYFKTINEISPDDTTAIPTMLENMHKSFGDLADGYVSEDAKRYVKLHGTSMSTEFFAKGMQYQQAQAGKKAANDHTLRVDADTRTVYADPMQYDSIKAGLEFDIANGVGPYSHIKNDPDKGVILQSAKEKLAWSAAMKAAEDPNMRAAILGTITPAMSEAEADKIARDMGKAGRSDAEITQFLKDARPENTVILDGKELEKRIKEMPSFMKDLDPAKQMQAIKMMQDYKSQEDRVANEALRQQVQNHYAYVGLTGQAPQDKLTRLDFGDDQAGWDSYNYTMKASDMLTSVWGQSLEASKAALDKLNPVAGMTPQQIEQELKNPAFADKVKTYGRTQELWAQRATEVVKDNINVEINSKFAPGAGGMTPLTTNEPQKWLEELEVRTPKAKASAKGYNLPLRILSDNEAKEMGKQFMAMGVNDQMGFLTGLGEKFAKDPDTVRLVMGQIAQGKPGLAFVGSMAYVPSNAKQNNEPKDLTSEYVLIGARMMNRPAGSGSDEERGAYRQQMPSAADAIKTMGEMSEYKEVSIEFSTASQQIIEMAMNHYVGKLAKQGVSNFDIKEHKSDFKESLRTVIGKPIKVGESKVFAPWGMNESDFLDAVEARVKAPFGTYGLRQPMNAPPTVFEVVQGGIVVGAVDISSKLPPVPKKVQPQAQPKTRPAPGGAAQPLGQTYIDPATGAVKIRYDGMPQ